VWNCPADSARIDSPVALLSLDRRHPVSGRNVRRYGGPSRTSTVRSREQIMTHRGRFLRVERLESRALPAVTIGVNAALDQHAINPLIYGTAFATTAQLADLNSPYNRSGGNAETTYNWQANATNHASDWYFESLPENGTAASAAADQFVSS